MAESSVGAQGFIDLDKIQAKLQEMQTSNIKITVNTEEVLGELKKIKTELTGLSNKKNTVKVTLDANRADSRNNISVFIDALKNTYKANPIKLAFGVDLKATNSNIKSAIEAIKNELNNQKFEVNLNTQNAKQQGNKNLPGVPAGNQNVDPKLASVTNIKVNGENEPSEQVRKYNLELGRTLTITEDLKKAEKTREVETTNYEAQAKALQKTNDFLEKQEILYQKVQYGIDSISRPLKGEIKNNVTEWLIDWKSAQDELNKQFSKHGQAMTSEQEENIKYLAFTTQEALKQAKILQKEYDDEQKELAGHKTSYNDLVNKAYGGNIALTGESKARVDEALKEYSRAIAYSDNSELTPGQLYIGKEALDGLKTYRDEALKVINEELNAQKTLHDEENKRAKDQAMYTAYMDKRIKEEDSIQGKSVTNIENAQAELERMKQSFFSGDKALTGEYATKANEEIDALAQSFDKLKEKASSSVEEAKKVTKDGLTNSLKDLQAQLRQLQKQEYPADKLAPKNVDVLKSDYASKIAAFREQLNEAGLGTSEFANRLADLETKLQSVGKIDNAGTPWAEWKADFEGLENKFKEFGNSVDGMKLKLSQSIGSEQLQTIDQLSERLSSLPEKLQGSGTEALKTNLQNLATEYQNVVNQLGADDLTKEQFDALTAKVKQLDDQLKQAANAAKIFGDGFKNEQAIQKYNLDVENLTNRFDRLKKMYEDFITKNPSKANSDIVSQITAFQTRLNSIDPTNITEINKEFRNLSGVVRDAISPSQTLSQILSQNFGALGQMVSRYASFAFIMQKVISVTKSMISEVRSLDSSLVELQKVTTLSGQSLSDFADRAYDVGAKLGRTGKDVIDAVTTFSRAGYDLNEATQMAESALVMTNVGVDIPNIESAASDMISIMTAFDKKAEESMSVIDKLYNVANKEPLDFGNITQMLVTSGGTLAQTGTSLEETMGLLTAAFKTLRDNSVSNG